VVADHQHVEMLFDRVHRVGHRRVGRGLGRTFWLATTLMMSGAWPPPAPSVWKAWIVRPLIAAACSRQSRIRSACRCGSSPARPSHRPPSGSSRWRRAWCPNPRAASAHAGPARTCSSSAAGSEALPLPAKARFIGKASAACIIRMMCQGPACRWWPACHARGRCRRPAWWSARMQRIVDLLGADEVDMRVHAARGQDAPLARDDLGARADDDVTPGWVSGLPALPIFAMRPSRRPTSAL
jgi:hypothetical protein